MWALVLEVAPERYLSVGCENVSETNIRMLLYKHKVVVIFLEYIDTSHSLGTNQDESLSLPH